MARHHSRFECGHEGCREIGNYESRTRADQARLHQSYGNGKWRCTRHSQPDQVLGPANLRRVYEITSDERPHGIYWGHFGFVSGPGFKAFARDFPPGTTLRVTAEIVPADHGASVAAAERSGEACAGTPATEADLPSKPPAESESLKLEDLIPEPPWPIGADNAKRVGWKAYYQGHSRGSCPFPLFPSHLRRDFERGWDAGRQALAATPGASPGGGENV